MPPLKYFGAPLVLRKLKGRKWIVEHSFGYTTRDGDTITVPKAFETDLASVPRLFWRIFPTDDTYSQAAVLHDYLCDIREGGDAMPVIAADGKEDFRDYSVEQVSRIFYDAMRELGVGRVRASLMYRAVLWFGPQW